MRSTINFSKSPTKYLSMIRTLHLQIPYLLSNKLYKWSMIIYKKLDCRITWRSCFLTNVFQELLYCTLRIKLYWKLDCHFHILRSAYKVLFIMKSERMLSGILIIRKIHKESQRRKAKFFSKDSLLSTNFCQKKNLFFLKQP